MVTEATETYPALKSPENVANATQEPEAQTQDEPTPVANATQGSHGLQWATDEEWEQHVASCDLCRNLAELLDRMDRTNRRLGKRSSREKITLPELGIVRGRLAEARKIRECSPSEHLPLVAILPAACPSSTTSASFRSARSLVNHE